MPIFIPLLLVFTSLSASAEIYTWQDKKGVTHFSEEKPDGQEAKSITVEEQMPVSLPPSPSRQVEEEVAEDKQDPTEAATNTATEVETTVSEVQNVNAHNINNPPHDAAHKPDHPNAEDVKEKIEEKVQDADISKIDRGTQTISKDKISNANAKAHDAVSK